LSRREMLRAWDGTPLVTVKSVALVAVPPGVVTVILPVVAPVGTVAVIFVAEFTVNVVAATPLNLTEVAPVKLVPVILTVVPTGPEVGVNDVIVGSGAVDTVKFVELVPVPEGVVTAIFPVVAPVGTVAVICVDEFTVNVALVPLNVTDVAPVKPVPVMTTEAPTAPEVGVNEVIVTQLDETVKFVELRTSAPHVVTPILPVVAPAGTNALS
jgi:hypothetical protein